MHSHQAQGHRGSPPVIGVALVGGRSGSGSGPVRGVGAGRVGPVGVGGVFQVGTGARVGVARGSVVCLDQCMPPRGWHQLEERSSWLQPPRPTCTARPRMQV